MKQTRYSFRKSDRHVLAIPEKAADGYGISSPIKRKKKKKEEKKNVGEALGSQTKKMIPSKIEVGTSWRVLGRCANRYNTESHL